MSRSTAIESKRQRCLKQLRFLADHGYSLQRPPKRESKELMAAFRSARQLSKNLKRLGINVTLASAALPPIENFYTTQAWREVRYEVLRRDFAHCACCGANAATGAVLHVDHIKPRSKYPELELDPDNLQVLCADCNAGKSNYYCDDWRGQQ